MLGRRRRRKASPPPGEATVESRTGLDEFNSGSVRIIRPGDAASAVGSDDVRSADAGAVAGPVGSDLFSSDFTMSEGDGEPVSGAGQHSGPAEGWLADSANTAVAGPPPAGHEQATVAAVAAELDQTQAHGAPQPTSAGTISSGPPDRAETGVRDGDHSPRPAFDPGLVDGSTPRPIEAEPDAVSQAHDRLVMPHDSDVEAVAAFGGDATAPERRTVVISDDGSSAVDAASEAPAHRRMDPRFRERRRAVRRALGRKRLLWLLAGSLALTLVVIGSALLGSSVFAVRADRVKVIGWQHADETKVRAVLDELVGTPVLRVDEAAVERRLRAIAWIDEATVVARLPNSATVEFSERVPLATYAGPDGRYRVLDRDGRVLDIVTGFPVEFVWITTDVPPDLKVADFAPSGLTAASEMTRNFTPTVRPRVRRIAVEPSGSALALYMRDGTRVNFGSARDLFVKLVRLETLLTRYPDMTNANIDVSTDETTRASDDLLKIKERERKAAAEDAAKQEARAEEIARQEAAQTNTPDNATSTSAPNP